MATNLSSFVQRLAKILSLGPLPPAECDASGIPSLPFFPSLLTHIPEELSIMTKNAQTFAAAYNVHQPIRFSIDDFLSRVKHTPPNITRTSTSISLLIIALSGIESVDLGSKYIKDLDYHVKQLMAFVDWASVAKSVTEQELRVRLALVLESLQAINDMSKTYRMVERDLRLGLFTSKTYEGRLSSCEEAVVDQEKEKDEEKATSEDGVEMDGSVKEPEGDEKDGKVKGRMIIGEQVGGSGLRIFVQLASDSDTQPGERFVLDVDNEDSEDTGSTYFDAEERKSGETVEWEGFPEMAESVYFEVDEM
ncbi:hypothetical protein BZA77DRAFT_293277 [Pyronema omphalodes]|nr:hypothetical protein BZA77DRAFT_293277 [Pyronema omphalodes]